LWRLDAPSESNGEPIIAREWCIRIGFVQELLGHATIGITLDTYSHMLPRMGGEAADAMDEALG
jgi:integrase